MTLAGCGPVGARPHPFLARPGRPERDRGDTIALSRFAASAQWSSWASSYGIAGFNVRR